MYMLQPDAVSISNEIVPIEQVCRAVEGGTIMTLLRVLSQLDFAAGKASRRTFAMGDALNAPKITLRLLARFEVARARSRTRRELMMLDAERLRDVGISADAARSEAAKPFWR